MKNYIVFNLDGDILRKGSVSDSIFDLQKKKDEFIMEGVCNRKKHKIYYDLDGDGNVLNSRVVDKSIEQIEDEKPKEKAFKDKSANLTNEQLQDILDRLNDLLA